MRTKTFNFVTTFSMVLTITVALLSLIGIFITGIYPGIMVLFVLTLIPISSKVYANKMIVNQSNSFQHKYFTIITVVNLVLILVVLWMTFVILIDHVFSSIHF